MKTRNTKIWMTSILAIATVMTAVAQGPGGFQGGPPPQGGQGGGQRGPGGPGEFGRPRQGPPVGAALLMNPQVIEELKLSRDQVQSVHKIAEKYRRGPGGPGGPGGQGGFQGGGQRNGGQQGGPPQGGPGGPGGPGQGGPGGEDMRQMEDDIKKVLDKKQFGRYKQISLQVMGPRAFHNPEIVQALEITEDQRDSIRQIMEQNRPQPGGPGQGGPGGQGGFDPGKHAEMLMGKIMGVLSNSQKDKWKEMAGAKFVLKMQQGRGPGGPGRPGGQGGPGGPPPGEFQGGPGEGF